jgi:hypothetical protein
MEISKRVHLSTGSGMENLFKRREKARAGETCIEESWRLGDSAGQEAFLDTDEHKIPADDSRV